MVDCFEHDISRRLNNGLNRVATRCKFQNRRVRPVSISYFQTSSKM